MKRPISIAGRQAFCRLISTAVVSKVTCENGGGKLPISPFVLGLYSSAKSPASLRSHMIYKGSARGPYVRFVRAPPSNGIGLIRSFCARRIAAFTTIFALFKNLGWEEKYCLSWQTLHPDRPTHLHTSDTEHERTRNRRFHLSESGQRV